LITDFSLIEVTSGRTVVERLELAAGYWSRLAGLQFRASLPAGRGLLLVPCGSVHTMMMRFAIDLVLLDATGKILGIRKNVRPWRLAIAPRGTHAVLEMPANTAWMQPGNSIALQVREKGPQPPRSLQFLQAIH
jgi:uncharacterized membrane protein (UPF0127 family)